MTKAKKGVISPGELHFYLIVGTAWAMSMLLLSSWLQQTFPEKATAPADESGVTKSQEFSVAKVQYDEVLYTQKLARVDTAITHLVRRHEDACRGKEQLLRVFLSHDILKADPSLCGQLPSTEQVAKLYGERPIILGLDSCNAYRTMLNGEVAKPRVSGLYNSGTSALQMFFARNSQLLGDDPTRSVWTVPVSSRACALSMYTAVDVYPSHSGYSFLIDSGANTSRQNIDSGTAVLFGTKTQKQELCLLS